MVEALTPTFWRTLFVGSRIFGFLLVLPGFGEIFIRPRIRLLMMMVLSIVFALGIDASLIPASAAPVGHYILEWVKGLFLGVFVRFILEGVRFLGGILSHQLSANAMASTHISQETHPVLSEFLGFFFLVAFFVLDLHHLFFRAFKESYTCFETFNPFLLKDMAFALAGVFQKGVVLSLSLATPFLIVALIYYIVLGFLNRFVPFVPVFFIGKPLEIATLFTLLIFCMIRFLSFFESHVQTSIEMLGQYG
jgi:flagellar biosynthetic protein FliR